MLILGMNFQEWIDEGNDEKNVMKMTADAHAINIMCEVVINEMERAKK